MNIKKILILSILSIAIVAMTISFVSADYHTKYKIKTYTSYYSYEDAEYYSDVGGYVWSPKNTKNSIYANPYIYEFRKGNKSKLEFTIYSNNGNKFHHTDCRSSKITINYKIKTNESSVSKTKTYSYNKIPKYGVGKKITLTGAKNSNVTVSSIKWSQVHRVWNHKH